jgi:hypothetical protein
MRGRVKLRKRKSTKPEISKSSRGFTALCSELTSYITLEGLLYSEILIQHWEGYIRAKLWRYHWEGCM